MRLLLGEPSWILPEHRGDPHRPPQGHERSPVRGDQPGLEANQLDEAGLATTFPRRALEDARGRRACQPLVALSIHPRYIAAPLGDIDFATAAGTRLGLDEAVFMT